MSDRLLDAFTRRLFSDNPPEWAAGDMEEIRRAMREEEEERRKA